MGKKAPLTNRIDPAVAKGFADRVFAIEAEMAKAKGEYMNYAGQCRDEIRGVLGEAKDKTGVGSSVLKAWLDDHRLETKQEEIRASIDNLDDRDLFEQLQMVLDVPSRKTDKSMVVQMRGGSSKTTAAADPAADTPVEEAPSSSDAA